MLFISDLHLDASRHHIARAFFEYLQQPARDADALYILGDLFELWVGDDDDDPFVVEVQKKLKQLSRHTPVYFIHGNRDFLIGQDFARHAGLTLLADPTIINAGGDSILLSHGDIFCTNDAAYQAFRAESRSAAWRQQVLTMSLPERRQLGAQLRQQSKSMSSRKAADIMDVSDAAISAAFAEYPVKKIIHGHTHRPKRHLITANNQDRERIVLGDWDNLAWSLQFDGDWQLHSWPIR